MLNCETMDISACFIIRLIFLFDIYNTVGETLTINDLHSIHTNTSSLNCDSSTKIKIDAVKVTLGDDDPYICNKKHCHLNEEDFTKLRHCEGKQSCVVDTSFTTTCVFRRRYVNISYTCKAEQNLRCGFQNTESCTWILNGSVPLDTTNWQEMTGKFGTGPRPKTDHTTGKDVGQYAILHSVTGYANLVSSPIVSYGRKCLTFWFFVHGNYTLAVKYKQNNSSSSNQVFSVSDSMFPETWRKASVEIDTFGSYFIFIQGILIGGNDNYIAIDDIDVLDGSCNGTDSFKTIDTFEFGFGMWQPTSFGVSNWSTNCAVDHTSARTGGGCVVISKNDGSTGSAQLKRQFNGTVKVLCLNLWITFYADNKYDEVDIEIYLKALNSQEPKYIKNIRIGPTKKDKYGLNWEELSMDFNVTSPCYVVIEVNFPLSSTYRYVGIDDIVLQSGLCPETRTYTDNCVDINNPATLQKCPSLRLTDGIHLDLGGSNYLTTSCSKTSVEQYIYQNCKNSSAVHCTFNLLDIGGSCFDVERNVTIDYTCANESNIRTTEVSTKLQVTAIAVGVTGGLVLILIIVAVIFTVQRKRRIPKSNTKSPDIPMGIKEIVNEVINANNKVSKNYGVYEIPEDDRSSDIGRKEIANVVINSTSDHRSSETIYTVSDGETYDTFKSSLHKANDSDTNEYDRNLDTFYDTFDRTNHDYHDSDVYGRCIDEVYDMSNKTGRKNTVDSNMYDTNKPDDGVYDTSTNGRRSDHDNLHIYGHSVDGIYDTSNNSRRNDNNFSIYGHSVNDVYDSTTHCERREVVDQTYNHLPP